MNWLDDLAEASWRVFWSKPGRLKPGEVPPPFPGARRTGKNTLFRKIKETMAHPLDLAIEDASNAGTPATKDLFVRAKDKTKLKDIAVLSAKTVYCFSRQMVLKDLALLCAYWLENLGISDPWQAMRDFYDELTGNNCLTHDDPAHTDQGRYLQVVEAVGKIATTLRIYNAKEDTIREITQLGSRALAWLAHEIKK